MHRLAPNLRDGALVSYVRQSACDRDRGSIERAVTNFSPSSLRKAQGDRTR